MQPSRFDASVTPKSLRDNSPGMKKPSPSVARNKAKNAILAEWPQWAMAHVIGRSPTDNDGHLFLRAVRTEHPEFFSFRSKTSAHETAFFWLLEARFIAY